MLEGRRNFPFVKVKGLERGLGVAGRESSLPVCGPDAAHGVNIPNILILRVHRSRL